MRTGTALLIVDVQTGLVAGTEPVYRLDELLKNIATLITQARTTGTPIIYIQDNDVDEIGSPGWQIHPAIAPEEGDLVLRKPEADAFYGTTLQQEMEARGMKHLIITGCKSEVCIDATCRRAVSLGYPVTLISDAHSTTDNAVLTAQQTIAYHNHILQMAWSDEHGEVVDVTVKPTSEMVTEMSWVRENFCTKGQDYSGIEVLSFTKESIARRAPRRGVLPRWRYHLSRFTEAELEYLKTQRLGRLATVNQRGEPQVAAVSFRYNPEFDAIDIGGA